MDCIITIKGKWLRPSWPLHGCQEAVCKPRLRGVFNFSLIKVNTAHQCLLGRNSHLGSALNTADAHLLRNKKLGLS